MQNIEPEIAADPPEFTAPPVTPMLPTPKDVAFESRPVVEPDKMPETPASASAPNFKFSNIRTRADGTYVVALDTPRGSVPEYHVCPPEVDPLAPAGLWDAVHAAARVSLDLPEDLGNSVQPAPEDYVAVLSFEKSEAERVIGLLQMELDAEELSKTDRSRKVATVNEWKRYRLALERDGLQAKTPVKPDWIQ